MSRFDRQSFLGPESDQVISELVVGFVGLGGGGSHAVQQYAHLGGRRAVLIDHDIIEASNLNRLVGGTLADVEKSLHKVDIAYRVIRGLAVSPEVEVIKAPWQAALEHLKGCDIIIGAVDSVVAKDELDSFCKRYCIPYIDIGMDVHKRDDGCLIAGQVVLTTPSGPCLRCLGIVRPEAITKEQEKYGAAGSKPQVVWPNGVLASTAIGLLVQLVCPWHSKGPATNYLVYDGNNHTVSKSPHLQVLNFTRCLHHQTEDVGDFMFDVRGESKMRASPT